MECGPCFFHLVSRTLGDFTASLPDPLEVCKRPSPEFVGFAFQGIRRDPLHSLSSTHRQVQSIQNWLTLGPMTVDYTWCLECNLSIASYTLKYVQDDDLAIEPHSGHRFTPKNASDGQLGILPGDSFGSIVYTFLAMQTQHPWWDPTMNKRDMLLSSCTCFHALNMYKLEATKQQTVGNRNSWLSHSSHRIWERLAIRIALDVLNTANNKKLNFRQRHVLRMLTDDRSYAPHRQDPTPTPQQEKRNRYALEAGRREPSEYACCTILQGCGERNTSNLQGSEQWSYPSLQGCGERKPPRNQASGQRIHPSLRDSV